MYSPPLLNHFMVNCKWRFGNISSYPCDPVRCIHSPIHYWAKFVINFDVALQYQAKVIIDWGVNCHCPKRYLIDDHICFILRSLLIDYSTAEVHCPLLASNIVLIWWIPVWSLHKAINYCKLPIFVFRACRIYTCEVACNAVDKKWDDQQWNSLWILNSDCMNRGGWVLQDKFRRFINLYTINYALYMTLVMMAKMTYVDELMKNEKANLTSLRVVIRNRPWDCFENILSVIWIPSWYL